MPQRHSESEQDIISKLIAYFTKERDAGKPLLALTAVLEIVVKMSTIAKISVEKFSSKEEILYDFDKSKGLEENVISICKKVGIPESSKIYGLKYRPTKTNERNHYISETNLNEIKHSDCLKAVFSVNYIIDRIIKNVHENENLDLRQIAFEDIKKLSLDPVFIEELAATGNDKVLIDVFVGDLLSSEEQLGLLITVVNLFSKGYVNDISQNILQKAINILKNSDTTNEESRFTLSLLHKILIHTNEVFDPWKEKIIRDLPITEINPYIWRTSSKGLQYSALLLINTIIRMCKGDKKQQLIREMNLRKTRENIYHNIIMEGELDKNMEHELYVLQTYLLSLFNEALISKIYLNENSFFRREEFELCSEDMRRITILMDFEEASLQNHGFFSVENLAFSNPRDSRISLASVRSDESLRTSSKRSSSRLFSETEGAVDNNAISHLTLEALRHYKNLHPKNFYQSQIEEQLYEPGIYITSEKVVKMLAKMLHIGLDPPDSRSTFYQPVVFYCSSPFFLELFSRTMWLLSRTRRDMKVSTFADYEKVMYILQKQVRTALKNKPKDIKSLTAELTNTTFKSVVDKIQNDKEEELKKLIENHPCVQEMKLKYITENENIVFQQRVNVLSQGGHFPKVLEKKMQGCIFVKLSRNLKDLMVFDIPDVKMAEKCTFKEKFKIEDITHVVIGKNCQHSNLCQNPALAFSIIIEHREAIKFIAKDEKTACYWTDALLLLNNQGNDKRLSRYYMEELNELVVMDIKLQLLELQNIPIPKTPLPIPPPPEIVRPEVPPRPKLRKHSRVVLNVSLSL